MLLGKERELATWKQGSNKWCSFSGKVEPEETALEGAAREFVEESLAVVPVNRSSSPYTTQEEARSAILSSASGTVEHVVQGRRSMCRNVVHILEIPYSQDLVARFRQVRQELETLDKIFRVFHRLRKTAQFLPQLCVPGAKLTSLVTVLKAAPDAEEGTWTLTLWDSVDARENTVRVKLTREQATEASVLHKAWRNSLDALSGVAGALRNHPALSVEMCGDTVAQAQVNRSYLEKSDIAWWKLTELAAICGHRNCSAHAEHFKGYFLDLLPHILEVIRNRAIRHTSIREFPYSASTG